MSPSPAKETRDDRRVDHAFSLGDPTEGVDENGNVEYALLEQVADPLWMVLDQPQRVAWLDVVGEKQHANIGVLGPDRLGGTEALIGVRRRHANVDDGGVGPFQPYVPHERVRVLGLGDDLDARVLEAGGRFLRA